MALPLVPASGLTLLDSTSNDSAPPNPAILLRLSESILKDIQQATRGKDGLQLVAGKAPKLRIGSRAIDLSLSTDAFRNELYTSSDDSNELQFTAVISHRADFKSEDKDRAGTEGTEDAYAKLQSSLASLEQEKKAHATNIATAILPTPKNRFEAATAARKAKKLGSFEGSESPLYSGATPYHGPGPTSAPLSDSALKTRAMRIPIVHLLAVKPISFEDIRRKTHVPKKDLEILLPKIGKSLNGKWQLTDKVYKDLDVWKFAYSSQDDRQAAIENATKAYDRQRLGKDEQLWQLLLPKEDRGKGIVLSRLQLGANQPNKGLTPMRGASPLPDHDAGDSKAPSAAGTPRLGPGTPRVTGTGKGDVMKRLLSKNPHKAQAQVAAKEKKRKERDDTASGPEGGKPAKRQATAAKANPKIKSAEIIHSSDEPSSGEEGEVKPAPVASKPSNVRSAEKTSAAPKSKAARASSSDSSDSSSKPLKLMDTKKRTAAALPAKPSPSPAVKPAKSPQPSKVTPRTPNNLAAPSAQRQTQRSPQKPNNKPGVPSPLGAARPRVTSDVSDRSAVGVQRAKPGAETPKGLGITNGVRKRHDTSASSDSAVSTSQDQKRSTEDSPPQKSFAKPQANGISKVQPSDTKQTAATNGIKRKANEMADKNSNTKDSTTDKPPPTKHRKTDSTSSQSQRSHSDSTATANSTARTSPSNDAAATSGSSDADTADVVSSSITFAQGVRMAQDFRDKYYPAYAKLYDEQAARGARGEEVGRKERQHLLQMHRRLEEMKRQIHLAGLREGMDA